jgi:hypothetical protein
MKRYLLVTAASAVILAGAALTPATALDLDVGGAHVSAGSGSDGGTSAGAGTGGTSAGATVGGGSNIGSATVGTGTNRGTVRIGTTSGSLVDLNSAGGQTNGSVNLGFGGAANGPLNGVTGTVGGVLDGIPGGAVTPGAVGGAVSNLTSGQIQALKLQCGEILSNPGRFDAELVALCSILRKL